jgi:hypothetical protein
MQSDEGYGPVYKHLKLVDDVQGKIYAKDISHDLLCKLSVNK